METWLIPGLILILMIAVVLVLVMRGKQAESTDVQGDRGATPEQEPERAEVTDPTQFGQVTPGAVTPAAAGSAEDFYDNTGVGGQGPKHTAGPPPVASEPRPGVPGSARSWSEYPSSTGWSSETESDVSRKTWLAMVAGTGAALGLGIFTVLRKKLTRRTRAERLREEARKAAVGLRRTGEKTIALSSTVPERIDARAGAGGGVLLASLLALIAATHRRRREAEARQRLAEAAAAEAARRRGPFENWPRPKALAERLPSLALVGGGLGLLVFGVVSVQRAARKELDWTGATVADSAPAREPPASP